MVLIHWEASLFLYPSENFSTMNIVFSLLWYKKVYSSQHAYPYPPSFSPLYTLSISHSRMDIIAIYAVAASGIFVTFFFIQTLSSVTIWADFIRILVSQHLMLPFII